MQWRSSIIILVLSLAAFFSNLGGYSISILDEAKNSTCAMEMRESDRYFYPTFNGEIRTDKPPLHYYFMSVAYSWFGYTPFAARFFSALMGVLTVFLTYFGSSKVLGARAGLISAIVLLSSIHLSLQFHLAVPDPYLIFLIDAGIMGFVLHQHTGSRRYIYMMYLALALAVLAKGPVAIALPGMIFLTYLLLIKKLNLQELGRLCIPQGVLLILLVVVPVYYQLHVQTDGTWTEGFFLKHNLSRFSETMEGHRGGIWYMPAVLFIGLLPYSVWLPQSLIAAWRDRSNPMLLVSLITVVVYILFFTLSQTKLPNYPVPCYAFGAILLGNYLSKVSTVSPWFRRGMYALIILLLAIPFGVQIGLSNDPDFAGYVYLWRWFLFLSLGGAGLFFLHHQDLLLGLVAVALFFGLFNLSVHFVILPALDKEVPTVVGREMLRSAEELRYFKTLNPAVPFVLGKVVPEVDAQEVNAYLESNPGNLVITNDRQLRGLLDLPKVEIKFEQKDLFEKRTWYFLGARSE